MRTLTRLREEEDKVKEGDGRKIITPGRQRERERERERERKKERKRKRKIEKK